MRITDLLLTETPRPYMDDEPFTDFDVLCPDPVVIDGTDVSALFMEMTMKRDITDAEKDEILDMAEAVDNDGVGWQMANFFQFDFSQIGVVAPPFDNFVIEFDQRQAMQTSVTNLGIPRPPNAAAIEVAMGRSAASFTTMTREGWESGVLKGLNPGGGYLPNAILDGPTMAELQRLPYRWVYTVVTWRYIPGGGLRGPVSTWIIPLDEEGRLFIDPYHEETNPTSTNRNLFYAMSLGPKSSRGDGEGPTGTANQVAICQGWQVILPALLTLSFMHTPRTTKDREGYHDLVEHEVTGRQAKKYLQRHFRPMTKWSVLDIEPLRRAIREANGGSMPRDFAGLNKALHIVRGHTATYMPNTYFGRKHDRPITVFRPSYKRGDAKHGVAQKDYAVTVHPT